MTPDFRLCITAHPDLKRKRQSQAQMSLSKVPPSSAEAEELHDFYLRFGHNNKADIQTLDDTPVKRIWLADTRLEKCMLMFPQERK
jgi:acyl-coenzyme A thioesterase 9